jgi:flagellar hook assembly protein FlgD
MYEQTETMAKQMIDLQRISAENTIGNMIVFWEQAGSMFNALFNQISWVPEDGKKVFREWVDSNKKGCETLRNVVNNGYASLGRCFERKD